MTLKQQPSAQNMSSLNRDQSIEKSANADTGLNKSTQPPKYQGVNLLDKIIQFSGIIARGLSLFIVFMTAAVAILRYGFNVTSTAWQEAVLYAHATIIMLGCAYALREQAHVRVDIFYRSWPLKWKAWIDLSGCLLLLLPSCIFLHITSIDYVSLSWKMQERSTEADGLTHLYLLKSLLLIAPVLLSIQGIQILIGCIRILRTSGKYHD